MNYDNSRPTVTVNQATAQADPTNALTINFTVVFSETVGDFDASDVTIGGTAGAATAVLTPAGTDGKTYTVAVTGMTQTGTVTLTVPAGVAHDQVGNPNVASTSTDNTVNYDITPPTVTINQATSQADPTAAATINFTVVFSEKVTGFVTGDLLVGGTAGATTATVTPTGTGGTTYNVAITGMTQTGTVIVSVPAGVAQDQVGYYNAASTSTDNTVAYDVTSPTVTINQAANQLDPAGGTTVYFTAVFSKKVSDFTGADVTITGTAGGTTATVTPVGNDGTTYNVAITGMTQDGTVVVSLGPGVAHDLAGNPNIASTSTDNSVTVHVTSPTVTIDQANYERPTSATPINFTIVFGELVSDFTSEDVTVTYSRPGTLVAIVTGSGKTYNVAVSGMTGDGTVTASIAAGVAHDAYGNSNVASTSTVKNGYADNIVEYLIPPERRQRGGGRGRVDEWHPRIERTAQDYLGRIESLHHRLADDDHRRKKSRPDQRPLRRTVFLLPDRNDGRRRSHVYDSVNRPAGRCHQQDGHVQRGGVRPADDCQGRSGRGRREKRRSRPEREAQNHLGRVEHRRQHHLADHDRQRTRHYADQRPLRRIVLLLPDRNLGGRLSLLHHPFDRFDGR